MAGENRRTDSKPQLLVIGKYEIKESLGRGAVADVFRAASIGVAGFRRPVVIKRILPEWAADRTFVPELVREARTAATLDHPNIVQLLDLGQDGEDIYLVMEDVQGVTLEALADSYRLAGTAMPHDLAAFIAVDVCRALEFARNQKDEQGRPRPVLHRDLCPYRVLLSAGGGVKLTDFGIARALRRARVAAPGLAPKNLRYLSPEQRSGLQDLDVRADLYSLGAVLHEILSGQRLFAAPAPADTARLIEEGAIPSLATVAPDVPSVLAELVGDLVRRNRRERPSSAVDVRRLLARYLRGVQPPVDGAVLAEAVQKAMQSPPAGRQKSPSGQGRAVLQEEPKQVVLARQVLYLGDSDGEHRDS